MAAEPVQLEIEELLEELRSAKARGRTKREQRRLLQSGEERRILRRASLVRSFDRETYDELLAADLPGEARPSFEEFVARTGIEPVPRTDGLYRVKEAARREALDAWAQEEREAEVARHRMPYVQTWLRDDLEDEEAGPETRREFALRALALYRRRGGASDLDRLSLTILANPVEAGKTFGRLYKQADERFDLPQCHSLLQVMEDRFAELPAELQAGVLRQRQRYNARSLFANEFYRTTTYHHRESLLAQLQPMLKPGPGAPAKWIFQLFATGGMGKTTFLRYLIARHCVPAGIPVARLDCDDLHLAVVGRFPWLALLPLAQQLNEQVEGRPFNELLGELAEFAPLIRRPLSPEHEASAPRQQAMRKLEASDAFWRENAKLRFRDKLAHLAGGARVFLLILDTLEELALMQPANLLALLDQIAFLQVERPELRLILSGRYDLRDRLPEFAARFGGATDSLRLLPFTEDESIAYLKKRRGLPATLPLRAIHEKAGGNPFKLSLFAELALSRESLTEEEVAKFPNAEFAYLIERIVDRIQEPDLRWVLRYGVVPRRLTRAFLEEVMGPHLRREMARLAGEGARLDRANESLPELYRDRNIFPEVAGGAIDFDRLWMQLRQYASSYGWMSIDPATDEPRFHPETIVPMRRLLEAQEIFPALHADAAAWFERKAAEAAADPARWIVWTIEAVHHRTQQSAADGLARWRAAIGDDPPQRDPALRKRLAEELTGPDYVDDEGAPLRRADGTPMIAPETLRHARRIAAECAIALAWEPEQRRREWEDAHRHLAALERDDANWRPLRRAAERLAADDRAEAFTLLRDAEIDHLDEQAQLSLLVQLGEFSKLRKSGETPRFYQRARRLRARMIDPQIPIWRIRRELASWYRDEERYGEALEEFSAALRETDGPETALDLSMQAAGICLDAGDYAGALARIGNDAPLTLSEKLTLQRGLLLAEAHLAQLDPTRAFRDLARIYLSKDARDRAHQTELLGAARGQLMQFDKAFDNLETARDLWHETGAETEPDRCRLRAMEIHLEGRGAVNDAYYRISEWLKRPNRAVTDVELRLRLMQMRLDVRAGRTEGARRQWNQWIDSPDVAGRPRWKATFLAAGLALGLTGSGELRPEDLTPDLARLAETLHEIKPFTLRLLAIAPLQWAAESNETDAAKKRRSDGALRKALREFRVPNEPFPHAFALAEAARFAGEEDAGATLLRAVSRQIGEDGYRYFEALRALNRWGGRLREIELPEPKETPFENDAESAVLCASILLAQAERALHREEFDRGLERLDRAAAKLAALSPQMTAGQRARHDELKGRILIETDKPLQAAGLFASARDLYAGLGDQESARRIGVLLVRAGSVATRGSLPAPATAQPQPQAVIRTRFIQLETDANPEPASPLRVSYTDPNLPLHLRHAKNTRTLADGLTRLLHRDPGSSSNVSRELLDFLLRDPVEAGLGLGRILFTREQAAELLAAPPLDLTLSLPFGPLARVPWEMVRLNAEKDEVPLVRRHSLSRTSPTFPASADAKRWIQQTANLLLPTRVPVDGLYGPQTEEIVGELQRRFGPEIDWDLGRGTKDALRRALRKEASPEPLRAWVLRPSEATRVRGQRGLSQRTTAEDFYTANPRNIVSWIEDPDVDAMRGDLADVSRYFDLIHVVASFAEDSRSGEIHLDFGTARTMTKTAQSARGAARITASQLNQVLAQMPADRVRPLVLLDAIAPTDSYEALRQLLLRNDFAASLFELGNVSGVIALGPALEDDMELARARLVRSLLRGESYSEAVAESRGEPRTSPFMPTFYSTALFTTDPSLSLIAAAQAEL